MAQKAPTSYKDPYWQQLAMNTEDKLNLPKGVLQSVLLYGEKSNADQVSSAGAKTPFQIIPQTRQGIIDNYGVDPYLSPENAAEGAGLLLKESLKRNNNDVNLAIREYHGGLDRNQWGKVNRAYVNRVTQGIGELTGDPVMLPEVVVEAPIRGGGSISTFEQMGGNQPQIDEQSLNNIYNAYTSGAMSEQDAADFESDIKSGAIMLPVGMELKGAKPISINKEGQFFLPDSVMQAYFSNQMSPQDKAELEADVANNVVRVRGGSLDKAQELYFKQSIPGQEEIVRAPQQPLSVADRLLGGVETAGTLVTGATTGAVGMTGGLVAGLAQEILSGDFGTQEAAKRVEEAALRGGEMLTYMPKTRAGQEQVESIGNVLQAAVPAIPLTGELAAITQAANLAKPVVQAATTEALRRGVVQPTQQAATAVSGAVGRATQAGREALGIAPKETPTAGTQGSTGAAGVDMGTLRQARANELPVQMKMTEGQRTRDFEQQRFEREIAKDPEMGAPIRDRFSEQQKQVAQNFDAFIDETGAQLRESLVDVGETVTLAIRDRAAKDKTKIRTLYKEAEKAGELSSLVDLNSLAEYLNANRAARRTTPILATIAEELNVQGIGSGKLSDGSVSVKSLNLKQAEDIRKSINKFYNKTDPNDARVAGELKQIIDDATENLGGNLYQKAREARVQFAKDYENIGLIKGLIGTKRGSADRIIAVENVVEKSIVSPSTPLASIKELKRILETSGEAGKQSWNELKGATIEYIRNKAYQKVETDQAGNRIISPAALERVLTQLDKSGKLDFVFGKKTAEQLRTVNDVSKALFTSPPGSVNFSNTASVLTQALDTFVTYGATGIPIPAMQALKSAIKTVKQRKVKKQVQEALK